MVGSIPICHQCTNGSVSLKQPCWLPRKPVNSPWKLSGQFGGINDENLELFLEQVIDV